MIRFMELFFCHFSFFILTDIRITIGPYPILHLSGYFSSISFIRCGLSLISQTWIWFVHIIGEFSAANCPLSQTWIWFVHIIRTFSAWDFSYRIRDDPVLRPHPKVESFRIEEKAELLLRFHWNIFRRASDCGYNNHLPWVWGPVCDKVRSLRCLLDPLLPSWA